MSIKNPKTYAQRLADFRKSICPYCGADGATLEKNKRGLRGHCVVCNAENHFSRKMEVI